MCWLEDTSIFLKTSLTVCLQASRQIVATGIYSNRLSLIIWFIARPTIKKYSGSIIRPPPNSGLEIPPTKAALSTL